MTGDVFALDTLHTCVAEFDFGGQSHAFSYTLFGTITDNGNGTFRGTATRGVATYTRTPPPTLTLAVDAFTNNTFDVTLTSDVALDGASIAASDLTITPVGLGTISNPVSGAPVRVSDTEYRFPITVVGRGDLEFRVAAGAINGATGLANTAASNTASTNTNDERPTGAFSGLASTVGLAGDQVTITFNEPVGLIIELLTLNNLRASNLLSGDALTYTFDVEPIADGPASIFLPAGLAADLGGNSTLAVGPITTNAVVSRPEITLASTQVNGPVGRSFTFDITRPGGGRYRIDGPAGFPGEITNFSITGFASNPAAGRFTIAGEGGGGPVVVSFPEGAFTDDESGNLSLAFAPLELANFDLTAPTPTITFEGYDLENTFTARITWDEDVTGFEAGDITPVNATLGAFAAVNASEYTVEVTAIDLSTAPSINIAPNVATDLAGNDNVAANGVPPGPDGTAPTLSIIGLPTDGFGGPQTVTLTFDFGERVLGFENSDIAVTGGTLGAISGGPQVWTAELDILGTQDVSVTVAAGAVLDASGTPNAETRAGSAADADPPTVQITGAPGFPGDPYTLDILFSEPVAGFVLGDIQASGAAVSDFTNTCGSDPCASFSIVVTAEADRLFTHAVDIPAGVAQDAASNDNLALGFAPPSPDGTAALPVITGVPEGFTGPVSATITIDFGEPVVGFDGTDVTITGGTLGALTGGPQIWTGELSVTGDADAVVSIAEAAAQDVTGTPTAAASVTGAFGSSDLAAELIREFMSARSAALLGSQPSVRGFLTGQSATGALEVTRGQGTISLQTGGRAPVWAALEASWSELEEAELNYALATLGAHTWLSEQALVGVMLQYDIAESEDGAARLEGTGWLAGPYFAAALGPGPVYVDGRLLYGRTDNEISPVGTYTDAFETERWLATLAVSGRIERPQVTWFPSLELAWTEDTQEAYTDGLSNTVPEQTVRLGELAAGLDFEHALNPTTLLLGGVSAIYADSSGGSAGMDGARGRLDFGLRHTGHDGMSYDLSAFYDGLGTPDYRAHGLELTFRFAF
ncbi:hypothetical protein GTA62_11380 [Roseobacter sp. HKCCD9010]|uniref:Ig-like domain-containing protein n=1 Tax=unclassified Roseobacter TaxID=196798 RepID=UPI0014926DCD|nr:hypothetical protein [Rhodobacterales bacterium HKCCD4356]NNV12458.1 hypothetical protein [Roseobacter sp. HKCCD7357]NNV16077.1 hypothetical protein [Roseobacter sp. HKCCD8768]NNV25537.1 hypothetical protein [Roseobacter sp. HKCCD8192]NNV29794.1 hypothetical protein [Roseobacter sp. HKCCD9061]NNV34391.1 hypothetical protein [Roseobacter sp. HKCCD9073]NNV38638.1 hypothetical protein [Roseobacter sp. HKCCD9054]NNV42597.1 hypothetical protein [Roseobacter sp. HKCCD6497]NNV46851.1 hypothetic